MTDAENFNSTRPIAELECMTNGADYDTRVALAIMYLTQLSSANSPRRSP